jgi:hypothetical protein
VHSLPGPDWTAMQNNNLDQTQVKAENWNFTTVFLIRSLIQASVKNTEPVESGEVCRLMIVLLPSKPRTPVKRF